MRAKKQIWFPVKRYGWGWGIPCCWKGWVVFGVYIILWFLGVILLPKKGMVVMPYGIFITMLLCAVCWWKGEKPRWRWGKN
jgi:hypothetical protein